MAAQYIRISILYALVQVVVMSIVPHEHLRKSEPHPVNRIIEVRPIIGVLTHPLEGEFQTLALEKPGKSFILQNYVLFLESAGARVVPVPYNATPEDTISLLSTLNGVLFTGGSVNLTDSLTGQLHPYTQTAWYIFEYAKKQVHTGGYFPLWGTCQGFQLLHILAANDSSVLVPSENWDYNINLNFAVENPKLQSRIFKDFSLELLAALATTNITFHANHWGIRPSSYYTYPKLGRFFKDVAHSVDQTGDQAIAVVEAKKYPFYAAQFHAEKTQYDFTSTFNINHSPAGIEAASKFAKFFINEAKRSPNKIDSFKVASFKTIENYEFYSSQNEKGTTNIYII